MEYSVSSIQKKNMKRLYLNAEQNEALFQMMDSLEVRVKVDDEDSFVDNVAKGESSTTSHQNASVPKCASFRRSVPPRIGASEQQRQRRRTLSSFNGYTPAYVPPPPPRKTSKAHELPSPSTSPSTITHTPASNSRYTQDANGRSTIDDTVSLLHYSNKTQEFIIEHLRQQLLGQPIDQNARRNTRRHQQYKQLEEMLLQKKKTQQMLEKITLRHQQSKQLEQASLQNKKLQQLLEYEKETHEMILAHWLENGSSMTVAGLAHTESESISSSSDKRIDYCSNEGEKRTRGPSLEPEGRDADGLDEIRDLEFRFQSKLEQLNSHIVMLNEEVDYWKEEHETLQAKYEEERELWKKEQETVQAKYEAEVDFWKAEHKIARIKYEALMTKYEPMVLDTRAESVIEIMKSQIEHLTRKLAEKEKPLQESPTIGSKANSFVMSLGDVKKASSCDTFSKTSKSFELSGSPKRSSQAKKQLSFVQVDSKNEDSSGSRSSEAESSCIFPPSPVRSMISTETVSVGTNSTSKRSSGHTSVSSISPQALRSSSRNSIASANTETTPIESSALNSSSPRSSIQSSTSSSKSNTTPTAVPVLSSSRFFFRYNAGSTPSMKPANTSRSGSDSDQTGSMTSADPSDDSSTSSEVSCPSTYENPIPPSVYKNAASSSYENEPAKSCLVSYMPYKDKITGSHGMYSGQIDIATKLPNGAGVLKCGDGYVLSGQWEFGVRRIFKVT